jgi:hypothetical protein
MDAGLAKQLQRKSVRHRQRCTRDGGNVKMTHLSGEEALGAPRQVERAAEQERVGVPDRRKTERGGAPFMVLLTGEPCGSAAQGKIEGKPKQENDKAGAHQAIRAGKLARWEALARGAPLVNRHEPRYTVRPQITPA